MSVSIAQLSSLRSSLDELAKRVETAASDAQASGAEVMAADLYEIERALATAQRRFDRLLRP
ncbi:MAG: hypothetical protein JOZ37_06745 [Actinobacteria bacterium]|nr:hypothetical protein [Actinomycetota bacterium]MBV8960467.1 hypothetical protein [Actinomycetota bacterium]MBV9254851.1 hypothetical protein [Actinomycetota bacterium]MBV9663646.1 hypothetical protein [Actinomycetota bacterium]MBV9934765.1 hypothetical protein [Actinomycetota bacterium]